MHYLGGCGRVNRPHLPGTLRTMSKKRLLLLAAVALVLGTAGVLLFRPQPVLSSPSSPVTLRYASGGDDPTFWVTNHTDKTLAITLRAVEVQTNGAWTNYSQIPLPGALYFTSARSREGSLAPHAAGFGSLLAQRVLLPHNSAWRVRASVAEKLVGGEAVAVAVLRERRVIEARRLTGNTNIPLNPFRKDVGHFGHSSDVVSEAASLP
jgi:hypothetical protein